MDKGWRYLIASMLISLLGAVSVHSETEGTTQASIGWWSDAETVQELGISSDQSTRLDEVVSLFRKNHSQIRDARSRGLDDLEVALTQGDFERAEKASKDVAAASSQLVLLETGVAVDAMKILDQVQRTAVAESYPQLLRLGWVRQLSGRGSAKTSGRRAPARSKTQG